MAEGSKFVSHQERDGYFVDWFVGDLELHVCALKSYTQSNNESVKSCIEEYRDERITFKEFKRKIMELASSDEALDHARKVYDKAVDYNRSECYIQDIFNKFVCVINEHSRLPLDVDYRRQMEQRFHRLSERYTEHYNSCKSIENESGDTPIRLGYLVQEEELNCILKNAIKAAAEHLVEEEKKEKKKRDKSGASNDTELPEAAPLMGGQQLFGGVDSYISFVAYGDQEDNRERRVMALVHSDSKEAKFARICNGPIFVNFIRIRFMCVALACLVLVGLTAYSVYAVKCNVNVNYANALLLEITGMFCCIVFLFGFFPALQGFAAINILKNREKIENRMIDACRNEEERELRRRNLKRYHWLIRLEQATPLFDWAGSAVLNFSQIMLVVALITRKTASVDNYFPSNIYPNYAPIHHGFNSIPHNMLMDAVGLSVFASAIVPIFIVAAVLCFFYWRKMKDHGKSADEIEKNQRLYSIAKKWLIPAFLLSSGAILVAVAKVMQLICTMHGNQHGVISSLIIRIVSIISIACGYGILALQGSLSLFGLKGKNVTNWFSFYPDKPLELPEEAHHDIKHIGNLCYYNNNCNSSNSSDKPSIPLNNEDGSHNSAHDSDMLNENSLSLGVAECDNTLDILHAINLLRFNPKVGLFVEV